jgi:hypothetical protein
MALGGVFTPVLAKHLKSFSLVDVRQMAKELHSDDLHASRIHPVACPQDSRWSAVTETN